jgi:serine/threonine protein phosphatase PrpC
MQGWRVNMEDTHSICLSLSSRHPQTSFLGCYDGHAGNQASIYLAAELPGRIGSLLDPTHASELVEAVKQVDRDFLDSSKREEKDHGSTCVFAVVEPVEDKKGGGGGGRSWKIVVGNIGDSRAVLIRSNGECIALTVDHKPENKLETDRIQKAGGQVSANRVDGQLAMSRAIGDYQYKDNPRLPVDEQKVIPIADITSETAREGDMLLLCCDGIVEQMTNEDAAKFIYDEVKKSTRSEDTDPAQIMAGLLDYSLQKGSKDNMSSLLMCFGPPGSAVSYERKDEFLAGPYNPYASNDGFVKAYIADAKKHGVEGKELMDMAVKAESKMPNIPGAEADGSGGAMIPGGGAGGGAGAGPGGDALRSLGQRLFDIPGLSQKEKLFALMSILQGQVEIVAVDDEEDGGEGGEQMKPTGGAEITEAEDE